MVGVGASTRDDYTCRLLLQCIVWRSSNAVETVWCAAAAIPALYVSVRDMCVNHAECMCVHYVMMSIESENGL